MKLKLIIILLFFCVNSFSQSTFIKWISTDEYDFVGEITEFDDGHFLVPTSTGWTEDYFQNYINSVNKLYKLNANGEFVDSLTIDTISNYEILTGPKIKIFEDQILIWGRALHKTSFDTQLCLLWIDFDLNIVNYCFLGQEDIHEIVSRHTINNNGNIVFVGTNKIEMGPGHPFLWEVDIEGNEIVYKTDTSFVTLAPSVIQIPATNNYHVNDAGGVLVYDHNFEFDTIYYLANIDVFADVPQQHRLIDDFHYIKVGMFLQQGIPTNWDLAFLILDNHYNIISTNTFGALDTNDAIGGIDFLTTDQIFLGGTINKGSLSLDNTWFALYKTNLEGDTIFSRYFGGYAQYWLTRVVATSDGGCLIAGEWWDFYNWIPGEPIDEDIVIMKLNEEGLITNISSNIPFEITDIIIYPNPGDEYIKIESSLKGLNFQLFNIKGEFILEKQFNSRTTIKTFNLETGNYIYRITQNGELIKSGKWIKK